MNAPLTLEARRGAYASFVTLRLQAAKLLEDAASLDGIPAHYRAQAKAASGIAALTLHRIPVDPMSDDPIAVRDDLEAIVRQVDPLIEAIGDMACESFPTVGRDLFEGPLRQALEGHATYSLECAAQDWNEWARGLGLQS